MPAFLFDDGFVFGLVGALVPVVPALLWIGRRIRSLGHFTDPRLAHFLDDWFGAEARPGFPAHPGVPERLQHLESTVARNSGVLAELRPNGGASIKDTIGRIEGLLNDHLRKHP